MPCKHLTKTDLIHRQEMRPLRHGGKSKVEITPCVEEIIMHSRRSLLFNGGFNWVKQDGTDFDVTMGSYDGAEVCELVGLYMLHLLSNCFDQKDLGLYRDDGITAQSLTKKSGW